MPITISTPTFGHLRDALGIGSSRPQISWKTQGPADWRQLGYELELTRDGDVQSYAVRSVDSVLVPWPGEPLRSRDRVAVRVRLLGEDGHWSSWSPRGAVEAGLLDPLDWTAAAITPSWSEHASDPDRRPPLLRRAFQADAEIDRARLYVTAHGLFEVEINGTRIGTEALSPGWTVYGSRLRYSTYDVTDAVQAGDNVIGAWMGDGWYRGRIGFNGGSLNLYGTDIALVAQLEITYLDGSRQIVESDATWEASPSPILRSSLYDGETFDDAAFVAGWSRPGASGSGWTPVRVGQYAPGTLVAPDGPPVRCTEELRPVSVRRKANGALLVDFGQNFAGRIHLHADSGVSARVTIRHSEVLIDDELETRPLRQARATDEFLGSSGGIDWEPRFTIHGFRFAEITGYDGADEALRITGRVYHSDMTRTGWLTTSNADLDRLHDNVLWSMRSNFVDLPTDCPQRDERLGWTGDVQVFAPTAGYLYDCSGFLTSWLRDLAIEQTRFGTVPWYVPVVPGAPEWTPIRPGAEWGDTAVLVPWTVYDRFGDAAVLAEQYPSARHWIDQVERQAGPSRIWRSGQQLGDWLDPAAPPDDPAAATTDPFLVSTAYFAWSSRRLAETAAVLGEPDDAARYGRLAAEVREAFQAEFLDSTGLLLHESQTGYALAIRFGLVDRPERAGAALAALVRRAGHRIGTGFAGVNLIADALTDTGQTETAYGLLLEESTPSWLSMVRKGATTIWERWDSLLDDGSVNPGGMTSFNHYALGSIADWMHRTIGGIEATSPGYREVRFAPRPGGGLTSAEAVHDSPYGRISCAWQKLDGGLRVVVELPTGTSGTVALPGTPETQVGPGRHEFVAASS